MIEGPVVGVGGRRKVGRMEYGEIRGFYVYKLQVLRTGTMDPPAMAIGPMRGYVIKKKKKKKKKKNCPSSSYMHVFSVFRGHKLRSELISTNTYLFFESICNSIRGTVATSWASLPSKVQQ